MRLLWCWRCQREIPMLDDREWSELMLAHQEAVAAFDAATKDPRVPTDSGWTVQVSEAEHSARFAPLLATYERLTVYDETNPIAICHHRAAKYGPPCDECGRPLRTPDARLCAECGASRRMSI